MARRNRPKGKRRNATTAGERRARRELRGAGSRIGRWEIGRLAIPAWQRWTHTLAEPKSIWVPFAEQFVVARAHEQPDQACAALLLALDNAGNWHALSDGAWVGLAGAHVYTYFDGSDYDDARVYDLVEAFLTWLHEEESLEPWDIRWLLSCIDGAREAHGVATKGHPRVHDPSYARGELDELNARFGDALDLSSDGRARTLAVLHHLADCLPGSPLLVRFGGLEPLLLVLRMSDARGDGEEPSSAAAELPEHTILIVGAVFYRWLADTGRLDTARAFDLSEQLLIFAAGATVDPLPRREARVEH